jgi:hypothetical protein
MKAKHHLLGFDRCFVPAVVKNQQTYIRGYVLDDEACSKMLITVKSASLVTLTDITFTLFVGLSISISKVGMAVAGLSKW